MILSVVVGVIASLLGGLSFLFVAVLFGAITASVIVFTTTLPVNNRKEQPKQQTQQQMQQKQQKPDEYHTLPFSAVVDPSRSKQNYNSSNKQNFKDVSEHCEWWFYIVVSTTIQCRKCSWNC
jgi:predicted lipid-binding transport protein (Tim44 family)